ncbi:MAG: phage holin family protein [Rhodothermales bacterium]|nr:phage holin family protein [Rhodothermales bacterium]
MRAWIENAKSLGEALTQVLRAEWVELQGELGRSVRRVAGAGGFLVLAVFILFWAIGVFVISAVAGLAILWPIWAAALAVGGVLAGIGLVVGWVAWRKVKSVDSPGATVRRRVDDHVLWWQERILSSETEEELLGSADEEEAMP